MLINLIDKIMGNEDKDASLVSILNDGNIPFKRIIEGNDRAFELEHRSVWNKNKIILFQLSGQHDKMYKMFIYRDGVILDQIEYDVKGNTWSVYNSLCLINKKYNG